MEKINLEGLIKIFEAVSDIMTEQCEHLCQMDALLGDGDLGLTMKRGFNALPSLIAEQDEPDMGKRLMKAGMKMSSIAPSTMGTLMSSGIMAGGRAISGKGDIDAAGFAVFIRAFADGLIKRGKCAPGDCTILDAIATAADRVEALLAGDAGASLAAAAQAAYDGAVAGVEATKDMTPKFGKALVQRAKAGGVPDQGATCGMYLLQGFRDVICA